MPAYYEVIKDHVDASGVLHNAGSVRYEKNQALILELANASFVKELTDAEAKKRLKAGKSTGEVAQLEDTIKTEDEAAVVSDELAGLADKLQPEEAATDEISKAFE